MRPAFCTYSEGMRACAACRCSSRGRGWPGWRPRTISSRWARTSPSSTRATASAGASGRSATASPRAQHAEAGGDMIDEAQHEIRQLAEELGAEARRESCAAASATSAPTPPGARASSAAARRAAGIDSPARSRRWRDRTAWPSSAGTRRSPRTSRGDRSRQWLDDIDADADLRATATGLRGFFLADPEELSLIALVDQFASSDAPAAGAMYRIEGGNDRLGAALAAPLGDAAAPEHRAGRRLASRARRSRERAAADATVSAHHRDYLRPDAAGHRAAPDPDHAGASGAAARRDRALEIRPRDEDAAAVLAAVLAGARPRRARSDRRCRSARCGTATKNSAGGRHPVAARRRRRQRRHPGARRKSRAAGTGARARLAGGGARRADRRAADRLGVRPVVARRLRVLRSGVRSGAASPGWRGRSAGSSSPASTRASSGRAT